MRKTEESKKLARVFISHASANLPVALEVQATLEARFDPWLDQSDIHLGVLLGKELQQSIAASELVVLIWSKAAAASRWVAAELLTAYHLDRFIVPCVLSGDALPQFLSRSVYCDLRRRRGEVLARLAEQLQRAPRARNEFPALQPYEDSELTKAIDGICAKQASILARLESNRVAARELQAELDPEMRAAEERWRYDPTILNLAGYHRKNWYMLRHWEEYCAGRFPADPVLEAGERFFFETLFVNPLEFSALNGLGNILLFQGELYAAEFFVERAVECARAAGVHYAEAVADLQLIRSRIPAPPKVTGTDVRPAKKPQKRRVKPQAAKHTADSRPPRP